LPVSSFRRGTAAELGSFMLVDREDRQTGGDTSDGALTLSSSFRRKRAIHGISCMERALQ
jgi:hypothetical protein